MSDVSNVYANRYDDWIQNKYSCLSALCITAKDVRCVHSIQGLHARRKIQGKDITESPTVHLVPWEDMGVFT